MTATIPAKLDTPLTLGAKIVGLSVLAAVVFGILFDLVSVHLSLEYFTEFHPQILPTNNRIALAFFWGIAATWWFGLIGGIVLAMASTLPPRPLAPMAPLRKRLALTLVAFLPASWMIRLAAFVALESVVSDDAKNRETNIGIFANLVMHNFAYFGLALAVLILAVITYRSRP